MLKPRTIQSKLFLTYSLFILLIIAGFVVFYYVYNAQALESKSTDSLYQLSGYILSQLDGELQAMNSLSDKILFSDPLKKLFYSDIYDLKKNPQGIYSQREFYDILYSITGPQVPVSQINLFQINGNSVGLGSASSFQQLSPTSVDKLPWKDDILRRNGAMFITVPHLSGERPGSRMVISLYRAFSPEFGKKPDSILEIQQDFAVFQTVVNKSLNTPDIKKTIPQKVFVFNQDGQVIYPLAGQIADSPETLQQYWRNISLRQKQTHMFSLKSKEGGGTTVLAFTSSDFSGWTVAVAESEQIMLYPVLQFRNRTLAATAGILLVTLVLSYFVARGLTVPIKKIHRNIRDLSLETITGGEPASTDSGLNEFEDLNRSFADMHQRLKNSLEEVVSARSHEIQAQLLALQSQMNPHFLYNTITVISILAESEGNDRIVKACMDLSGMLRYISTGSSGDVTVRDELEHTENYLNLMKIRYREKLRFTLDIPDDLKEQPIPKLVVQPLVENCTKYAINLDPPWEIEVTGKQTSGGWEITVQDNGQGFSEPWLEETRNKMRAADASGALPGLKLDGMGLMNIYLRLRLKYGEQAIFRPYNHPDGGAAVTIGCGRAAGEDGG